MLEDTLLVRDDPGQQHTNDDEWVRIGTTDHHPLPDVKPDSAYAEDGDDIDRRFLIAERVLDDKEDRWEQEWVDSFNSRHAVEETTILDRIDLPGAEKHRA